MKLKPLLSDGDFLTNVRQTNSDTGEFHVWWIGQSGFLIKWKDRHLLLDPYLSDSLTKKYDNSSRPHIRMTERVIDPARLNFIDIVSASHGHSDHLDEETLKPLFLTNPEMTLLIPEAIIGNISGWANISEWKISTIDAGQTVVIKDFKFHAIPSAHEELYKDEKGSYKCLGYIVQFGRWTVYHSGDTVLYEDMVETLRHWNIDVAFLPINGRGRGVTGNLWGREAAQLASATGLRMVIPCHFDLFEFNTASPYEFIQEAEKLNQPYHVLKNGEHWCSDFLKSVW